jgi:small redox-active disulfide protein 2
LITVGVTIVVSASNFVVEAQSKSCRNTKGEKNMLTIKILGSGCPNCKKVEAIARQSAQTMGMEAEFIKVTDYNQIMNYNIVSTPGLVINEKLVCSGRIPTPAEVTTWLVNALS